MSTLLPRAGQDDHPYRRHRCLSRVRRLLRPLTLAFATMAGLVSLMAPSAAGAADDGPYRLARHLPLDAAQRWDYLAQDPLKGRIFVTLGDHVTVVDPRDGRLLGRIAGLDGAHGVAFAKGLSLGFISNGKTGTITTFDLDTLAVLRTTPAGGENPDALLYLDGPGRLYSFNGKSRDITVIDPATGHVDARIPLTGRPEFAAADARSIYLNLEDTHALAVIDIASARVLRSTDLTGCEEPTGLDLDIPHGRVFSVCQNRRMLVTAMADGAIVASVPIGEGPDAVVYDSTRGVILSSNGKSGTLTIVRQDDADHYRVLQNLPTVGKARTLAYGPATGKAYLTAPGSDRYELLEVEPVTP